MINVQVVGRKWENGLCESIDSANELCQNKICLEIKMQLIEIDIFDIVNVTIVGGVQVAHINGELSLDGYLTFEQRLRQIGLLSYEQRRKIAQVILIRKIETDLLQIDMADQITRNTRTDNFPRRGRNVYDISRSSFSPKGPIARAMRTANELSLFYSEDDSIPAIRSKLRRHFLNNQPATAQFLR